MTNGEMTLNELLQHSQEAAREGNIADSWRLMHQFATTFWLENTPRDIEAPLLGEYWSLRAGVADCLGMTDEAVESLHALKHWAQHHDPAVELIADAHLAYQTLNAEETDQAVAPLLAALISALQKWEGPAQRAELDKTVMGKLTLAATIGYTVALNATSTTADVDSRAHADQLGALVRTFGTTSATEADRLLWFAQAAWADEQREEARMHAELVAGMDNPIAQFEAHDMLATFDMLEFLEDHEPRESMTEHWLQCATIAHELGASLLAAHRTELACRGLLSRETSDDDERAWRVAGAALDDLQGAPISPALLQLSAVVAEAAYNVGNVEVAMQHGVHAGEWYEMHQCFAEAARCYDIALHAHAELGMENPQLEERLESVLQQLGNLER